MLLHIKKNILDWYQRACVARDKGDLKTALMSIDKAIDCFPKECRNFNLLITKGDILKSLKRYSFAEEIARKAVEVKPNHWAGWLLLGMVQYELKNYQKATYCLKKVVAKKKDYNLYTVLANCELAFDSQAAYETASKALKLNPSWVEAKKIQKKAEKLIKIQAQNKVKRRKVPRKVPGTTGTG